ncbi:MAG TPA: ribbon-helix-helix domain-containing protein [Pyrinomonadaceae bacterium]|nr:type II toxin-antitoxin system ParD family antitoxin [Acidobacteriota bacterium]HQZ95105.1 ribbon-helix-helix domain-containing protein [Pyrinomonadaceae bacterium]
MSSISTINISLPHSMKQDVDEIIANEGYGNTSEFFRDLVRRYMHERRERRLEDLLVEGLKSGDPTPLTKKDFEAIKERGLKRLQAKIK